MLNRAVGSEARPSFFGTLLGALIPQRMQHRITFALVAVCLTSVVMGIALFSHAQSNQVLLVANARAQAMADSLPASQVHTGTTSTTINASKALIRIDQSDLSQYVNQEQHDQWWGSTCSTASLTEVMNAYGRHYTIKDVLAVEAKIGAITADHGLMYDNGVNDTALRFGFEVTVPAHPSISQLIETANAGTPVIVNFPPHPRSAQAPDWSVGHFLVVTGGTATHVRLADSSIVNHGAGLQDVSIAYFLTYWHGYERILTPSRYITTQAPTLSASQVNVILAHHHSPAAGLGQAIYDMSVKYGIDDAYVMVTFGHESTFGLKGEARESFSPGNLRCGDPLSWCKDAYAHFRSWQDGFDALYRLLKGSLYAGDQRIIPETIIPRFAPQADNNDEATYIATLKTGIDALRAGQLDIPLPQ